MDDLQSEVERVAAEDVAHVVAADDHDLEANLLRNRLQASGTHLARRSDGKAITRDHERLAAVHACPEIGHQVPERARLPALVEGLEIL